MPGRRGTSRPGVRSRTLIPPTEDDHIVSDHTLGSLGDPLGDKSVLIRTLPKVGPRWARRASWARSTVRTASSQTGPKRPSPPDSPLGPWVPFLRSFAHLMPEIEQGQQPNPVAQPKPRRHPRRQTAAPMVPTVSDGASETFAFAITHKQGLETAGRAQPCHRNAEPPRLHTAHARMARLPCEIAGTGCA